MKKQKKEKEKKKEASLWPRPARLHSPSSPTAPTGLPTALAFTQRARSPACGPAHVAHAHASSARLPSLPPDPTRQPHVAHARTPLCFLLAAALTQPHTSRLMHRTPLHRSIAAHHGSMELGYKTPASDARELSCAPPPPCGHPQHTQAKREEGEEEEGGETPKPLRGGRACRSHRSRG